MITFKYLCLIFATLLPLISNANADYSSDTVLEGDRAEVAAQIKYIKENFSNHFGVPVEVQPQLIRVDSSGGEDNGEYSFHQISFGKLSKKMFEKLDDYYKFPLENSMIPRRIFDPNISYTLVDFFLPKMQPLAGYYFYGEKIINKNHVSIDANCWSTVHDILYSNRSPFSITGFIDFSSDVLPKVFMSPTTSDPIDFASAQSVKAYDYFIELDEDPSLIQHTAVFVGPGLVFEKTAPSEIGLYRVSVHNFEKGILYRRLKSSLPSPQETAAMSGQVISEKMIMTVTESKEHNPIYRLDSESPIFDLFKKSSLSTCTQEDFFNGLCH